MQSMSAREAVQALCFLSDLGLSATLKGWIIRGVFEARGNGREVAEAFVTHYRYSDQTPYVDASYEGPLPASPRKQLLDVFCDRSGQELSDHLIAIRILDPSVRNAGTPDQLLAISYTVKE